LYSSPAPRRKSFLVLFFKKGLLASFAIPFAVNPASDGWPGFL
jgi:hypothetical protein